MNLRSRLLPVAVILTLGLVLPVFSAPGAAPVEVTGPIEGGLHGMPFNAPAIDVSAFGYVVEEFFLDGRANAYRLVGDSEQSFDGLWQTEREAESVPFRTRILVVRPTSQDDFNGTVIVHWQNVTAGYELGTVSGGEYLRGYAWVGVSAQAVGVNGFEGEAAAGLRQWDEQRYGTLVHPGDAYSYDIFSQAGRVVGAGRPALSNDPMGGLDVERLVAAGASQSASRLRTYINGVQPIEGVFDGFIPYIDFASPVSFEADKTGRRTRLSGRIREDLGVPVFVVNSETETMAYLGARQPETATFRFWEVPGTSHVSVAREAVATTPGMNSPNWLSYTPVYDAAVRHMHFWLSEGVLPPIMPPIEVSSGGSPAIVRDDRGNALGGIRLPEFDVASAEHQGTGRPVEGGSRFAFLYGYSREFSPDELATLYSSPEDFMRQYDAALYRSLFAGVILPEDAAGLRGVAARWAADSISPVAP